MTAIKLKPCPFCGGPAHFVLQGGYNVMCARCTAKSRNLNDQQRLADEWNRRAALADDHQAEALDQLKQAYALGFAASGEGYNAEYPFDADFESYAKWVEDRDLALSKLIDAPAPEHRP